MVYSTPDRFVLPTHLRQFSNVVVWGTTLRRYRLLQNGGFGQFEGWGWNVRGRYRSTQAKSQKFGGYHRIDSMQAVKSTGAPVI